MASTICSDCRIASFLSTQFCNILLLYVARIALPHQLMKLVCISTTDVQTGARLLSDAPKLEKNDWTARARNRDPITGISLIDAAAIGKNWPNKYTMPYSWRIIPETGQRHITKDIPKKKAIIPRMRSRRVKNFAVREKPGKIKKHCRLEGKKVIGKKRKKHNFIKVTYCHSETREEK